jgi:threonine/homoserine/homoserine lactone efflux protein
VLGLRVVVARHVPLATTRAFASDLGRVAAIIAAVLELVLLGSGFGFAAAVQPGPLQAFLLSRVMAHGCRRTLPAAFAPLLSDAPIALLMLFVLRTLPLWAQRGLRIGGGLYLLVLAWSAFREVRTSGEEAEPKTGAPRTLSRSVAINLLNPNPYLGWAFVLGPAALSAWQVSAWRVTALVGAFYSTMTITLAAFIAVCGTTRLLPPHTQKTLMALSATALALLGGWQIVLASSSSSL